MQKKSFSVLVGPKEHASRLQYGARKLAICRRPRAPRSKHVGCAGTVDMQPEGTVWLHTQTVHLEQTLGPLIRLRPLALMHVIMLRSPLRRVSLRKISYGSFGQQTFSACNLLR